MTSSLLGPWLHLQHLFPDKDFLVVVLVKVVKVLRK